jgi:toxin HigB-1
LSILDVLIDDKELEKLYTTGTSRKLNLPGLVNEKFLATIQRIESSTSIFDFRSDKGLHFEKLKGLKNIYSMRLSSKYRLEMEIEWLDDKNTIGKFLLLKISNHYS